MFGNATSQFLGPKRKALLIPKFNRNITVAPSFPAHQPGDLIVVVLSNRTGGTVPTITNHTWNTIVAETHPNGTQAIGAYWMLASAAGLSTITTSNALGMRAIWVISNGAYDAANVSNGTTTTFAWESQPAFTANSLMLGYVVANTAQTSMLTPLANTISPTGPLYTQTGGDEPTVSAWAGDSQMGRLSAFAPSGGTFDTSTTKWTALAISIKKAAP
jgi:hypothetical protein